MTTSTHQFCQHCRTPKPRTAFDKRRPPRTGRYTACKTCRARANKRRTVTIKGLFATASEDFKNVS